MNEPPALGHCPVCGTQLTLSCDLIMGELLECDDCETELEVVGLGPVELKETPAAEEPFDEESFDE